MSRLPLYVNTTCNKTGFFTRHKMRIFHTAEAEMRKEFGDVGLFISPMRFYDEHPSRESEEYGELYLDFDSEDPEQSRLDCVRAAHFFTDNLDLDVEHINIFYSGSKGYHIMVNPAALGVVPMPFLRRVYEAFAHDLKNKLELSTLDMSIYTHMRLLRVPNTRHIKTGNYKIWLPLDTIEKRPHSYIEEQSKNPGMVPPRFREVQSINPSHAEIFTKYRDSFLEKQKAIPIPKAADDMVKACAGMVGLPVCIEDILERFITPNARRFEAQARVIAYCKTSGVDEEECEDLLNERILANYPPTRHEEVLFKTKTSVQQIYRGDYTFTCAFALSLTRLEPPENKVKCAGSACPLYYKCGSDSNIVRIN